METKWGRINPRLDWTNQVTALLQLLVLDGAAKSPWQRGGTGLPILISPNRHTALPGVGSLADLAVGETTFRRWPMSARVAGFMLRLPRRKSK